MRSRRGHGRPKPEQRPRRTSDLEASCEYRTILVGYAGSERGGSLWRSLLDGADEHDVGALVLGTRGLTGLSRALGSVSNGVVHHSRRPVLMVPAS